VVRCKDELPAKYLPRVYRDSYTDNSESEADFDDGQALEDDVGEEDADASIPLIEPDPSIHEPVSENAMTAARAWEAARCQLQREMPKSAYDGYVRDLVLLSAREGKFVVGASDAYAREWLESQLTSTITRLLDGNCSRSVHIRFVHSG
jgi:hypothetical protein